jgi:ribosomal protein S18 acetylase RimI-like enzyme
MRGQKKAVIEEIVVSENHRRQGFAKMLLHDAEIRIAKTGAIWTQLNVFDFNKPAQELYKSLGYAPVVFEMGKKISQT